MKAVFDLISEYGEAVRQYEAALPCASGQAALAPRFEPANHL